MLYSLIKGLAFFVIIASMVSSCAKTEEIDFNRAKQSVENKEFLIALAHLEKIIKKSGKTDIGVRAAREAARISYFELKDYKRAINFYKNLVLYSRDPSERIFSQQQIASIYFDHLTDYKNSISEYNKLLQMPIPVEDQFKYKLIIARAYYYVNNFQQAESDVESLLKVNKDQQIDFQLLNLKANIRMALKDSKSGVEILENILEKYPEQASKENVGINLALAHEEAHDLLSAIRVLEKIRPYYKPAEYIDLRIKRIKERQKNQPGARGLRK